MERGEYSWSGRKTQLGLGAALGLTLLLSAPAGSAPIPVVGRAVRFDLSPPLSSIVPKPRGQKVPDGFSREIPIRRMPGRGDGKPGEGWIGGSFDPLVRDTAFPNAMPAPIANFAGTGNRANSIVYGFQVFPPDTNGDVGPDHYAQTVNLLFQVFDKSGGSLFGPIPMSTFFAGFGGECEAGDDGDPIVLYDELADRWLVTQFGANTVPSHQCVCVSQTGDPTGAYYRYDFVMPNDKFNDYPHFGVWPDAYFMTDNQFNSSGFAGAGVFALDRLALLAGDPGASYVYFDLQGLDPTIGGMLPADLDGANPPPAGTPGYFAYFTSDEFGDAGDGLRLFEFAANFAVPGLSSFVERAESPVAVAAFNPFSPPGRDDVPQPPPAAVPAANLDSISDRLMHRLAYRNFGSHESLAVTHNVDVDNSAAYLAGVRHYEVRRALPGGSFAVNEEGSSASDGVHRWMGSVAMDYQGNLAVGYSASSTSIFPSIRYAGRLASDPPGGLFQGEADLVVGGGSQTDAQSRWGDYSGMSIDPADGCTFWYTSEYYTASNGPCPTAASPICWATRIGSFKFPGCTAAPRGTLQGTVTDFATALAIAGARVGTPWGPSRVTDAAGAYSFALAPGTYDVTASRVGYQAQTAAGVIVAGGATVTRNFALAAAPILIYDSSIVDDSLGNGNGIIDGNECVSLDVLLANTGVVPATGVGTVLSTTTPGVAIPQSLSAYPDIAASGSAASATAFEISTLPSFVCGTPIDLMLGVTTSEGPFVVTFSLPTGTVGPAARFDNNTPLGILDGTTVGSSLTVAGVAGAISNVTVSLQINHTWDSDLIIALVAPDGTPVVLANAQGGAGDNFGTACSPDSNRTSFDDAAVVPISGATPPFVGTFRPDQALAEFDGLTGGAVNGTWTLEIEDTIVGDTGVLNCWSLFLETATCTDGGCLPPAPDLVYDASAIDDSGGNNNAVIDLNECVQLAVTLRNTGNAPASGISATLSTSTPEVAVVQAGSLYPEIGAGATGDNRAPFAIHTSPAFVCGTPIGLTLAITTAQGVFADSFMLPSGTGGSPLRFDNNVPVAIIDHGTVTSTMPVAGVTTPIRKATASVYLTHTYDSDLIISLLAPDATRVRLSISNGGNGQNFGAACAPDSSRTTFDDAATTPIGAGIAPFVGSFRPDEPLAGLIGKSGAQVNGDWKLEIRDVGDLDIGTLFCWSLVVEPFACTDGGGVCSDPCLGETVPPTVTPPNATTVDQSTCAGANAGATSATSAGLAAFLAGGSATDNCDPAPLALPPRVGGVDADSSTFFLLGATTVAFRFQDGSGNIGVATSIVTVALFFGDLDEDGLLNAADSVILANFAVGNLSQGAPPFTAPLAAADVNQSGAVDAVDQVILANRLVGNISCLPVP